MNEIEYSMFVLSTIALPFCVLITVGLAIFIYREGGFSFKIRHREKPLPIDYDEPKTKIAPMAEQKAQIDTMVETLLQKKQEPVEEITDFKPVEPEITSTPALEEKTTPLVEKQTAQPDLLKNLMDQFKTLNPGESFILEIRRTQRETPFLTKKAVRDVETDVDKILQQQQKQETEESLRQKVFKYLDNNPDKTSEDLEKELKCQPLTARKYHEEWSKKPENQPMRLKPEEKQLIEKITKKQNDIMAKTIGISDEVYIELLNAKHDFEKREGRVISYDEIIKKLIDNNNNNDGGEGGEKDTETLF